MEIREITDKNTWENFIKENSPQSLFQSWNWGEIVKKYQISNIKYQILWRFGLYEKEKLAGIAQVAKIIAKRGTFLHVRHGPIFSTLRKNTFMFLLSYLKELAEKEKATFLRVSPLISNSDENKSFFKSFGFIDSPMHSMDGEYCWVIDIKNTEEELLSHMRKTTRYLIKQAQKMGVEIMQSNNKEDIKDFFTLYDQTAQRHKFIKHQGIQEEFEQLLKDDQILLFRGYYQKQLISAALVIFYNHQAIYHHSASREQKIPVNYLMQWEILKEAKRRGKSIYNLWGIAPDDKPRHPWRGLTIFKKGFGGEKVEYLHMEDLPFSIQYCTTYAMEIMRKVWKGY